MSREEELEKQITEQGDKIRKMKTESAKKVWFSLFQYSNEP